MKQCMKTNCYKPSIKRGKYCEEHRSNKRINSEMKRDDDLDSITVPISLPPPIIYDERKHLIEEQDKEYKENELIDLKRFEEIENKKYEKQIKDFEIDSLRNKVFSYELTENSFQIKFSMSNGTKILHYFNNNALFEDLFEYLDVYFYDNNINIPNYDLVCFPNRIFTKQQHMKTNINKEFTTKNIVILIKNLDV